MFLIFPYFMFHGKAKQMANNRYVLERQGLMVGLSDTGKESFQKANTCIWLFSWALTVKIIR